MSARSRLKKRTQWQDVRAKLFIALVCSFLGISNLGCTHDNKEEAPKQAPPPSPTPPSSTNTSHETSPPSATTSSAKTSPVPENPTSAITRNSTEQDESLLAKKSEEQKIPPPNVKENVAPAQTEAAQPAKKANSTAPAPASQFGRVDASRLNVRQQPALTATKLTTVPRGTKVKILAEKEKWYHISAKNGALKGWVAKRYIQITHAEQSSPHTSAEESPGQLHSQSSSLSLYTFPPPAKS